MRASTVLMGLPLALALLAPTQAQQVRTGSDAFGTWESDAPGVSRHIRATDLPEPTNAQNNPEAPDFERAPKLVDAPQGKLPDVPKGFNVQVFASGLKQPRVIRIASNGDIFVAESQTGRVLVFPANSAGGAPAKAEVFAEGLEKPYGIVFLPPGNPRHVYVGAANQVVRYAYRNGDRKATTPAEVIIPDIPTKRHWTRDLEASPDGQRLFVSVGSASNVAAAMQDKPPQGIQVFERTHGVGAAWGEEENRAVVRVFDPEGESVRNYATGLRNCSGMAMQPGTGTLWCTGNERDHLGANLVPDFLTTVRQGGFYGWPWYYTGGNEDPAHAGERPDLKDKVIVPEVLIQAHSSTLDLVFYDADAFPAEYRGDAFATLHGSWNREERTGYKVIRARMKDGKPTGVYEDFMTGFVLDKDTVWGRPAGIAVAQDGALLVSDDANGTIFRVMAESPSHCQRIPVADGGSSPKGVEQPARGRARLCHVLDLNDLLRPRSSGRSCREGSRGRCDPTRRSSCRSDEHLTSARPATTPYECCGVSAELSIEPAAGAKLPRAGARWTGDRSPAPCSQPQQRECDRSHRRSALDGHSSGLSQPRHSVANSGPAG